MILSLFLFPRPLFSQTAGEDQIHLQKGTELLFSGKLDLAEKEFLEALAINSKLHRAYFGLGLIYLQKNSPEKGEKAFNEAIRLQPEYAPAFRGLGQAAEQKNDLASAVTHYQKAVALEKVNPAFANDAAIARFRLSQIGETPEKALKAVEHRRRGKELIKEKKNDAALKEFLEALDLVPQNLDALENSAVIFSDLGKFDESSQNLKKIISIDPEILFAHYLLGLLYEAEEKIGESWEEYQFIIAHGEKKAQQKEVVNAKEKIKELGPSRESAIETGRKLKEAAVLAEKGEYEEAEKRYQEVLRLVPENIKAQFGLGLLSFSKNKINEAKQYFLPVSKKDPEMLLVHFYLGKIYLSEKEIEKAFAEMNQVQQLGVKPLNSEKYKKEIEEAKKDLGQFGNDPKVAFEVGLLLKEGDELVKKEDFEQAKVKFKRVLDLSPQNLEALENLGLIYMRLTSFEPEKAREVFEKMLSINPDLLLPMFRLGGLFENQGDIQKALSLYEKTSVKDPKEGGYGERARKRIHQMGGSLEKAKSLYALLKEGERLLNEKRWEGAVELFQKALQVVPDQTEALYSLGLIYLQQKEGEKAEKTFRALLEADPENLEGHFQLGLLLGATGRYEEAAKELQIVVAKGKEGKTVQSARAEIERIGQKGGAEQNFKNGMELLVKVEEIQKKGPLKTEDPLFQEKKNLLEKAVGEFLRALQINPDNPVYFYNLGLAYVNQFDLLKAQRVFLKVIELKPDMMQAHYQLGIMYEAAGAVEGALKEYQAVMVYGNEGEKEVAEVKSKIEGLKKQMSVNEEAKGYSLVANFLFLELKESEKAAPLFLKATELDPRNGDYWYDLGIYYEAASETGKAEMAYRKAIQVSPNSSKPYFYLGLILEKRGEVREAIENFKKAKEFEVVKTSKEAEFIEARLLFYGEKLRKTFSASPFLYDNNPTSTEKQVLDYAVSGNYTLNLKYFYYKSPKALISSSLNLSASLYYYSQVQVSNDSLSIEGYWPDWNGIEIGAATSLALIFAPGGLYGWDNMNQGDLALKIKDLGSIKTHIGYFYLIANQNPFYNSVRLNVSESFFKEHFGPGSLTVQIGVTNSEVGAPDDSNLSWNSTLTYNQPVSTILNSTVTLGYGETYFKNPDSFASSQGLGQVYRKNRTLNLSLSLGYLLYKDLTLSVRGGWEKVDSNLSTFFDRNVADVLTALTASIGSYTKMTVGTTIIYTF